MRVFMRYGKGEIDLGEMPVLPSPDDRVRFAVPADLRQDADEGCLTVGRRIFEIRPVRLVWANLDPKVPPERLPEWVCILQPQETR